MPLRPEAQVGPSTVPALWCVIYQKSGKHATCYKSICKLHNSCSATFADQLDMLSILARAMN